MMPLHERPAIVDAPLPERLFASEGDFQLRSERQRLVRRRQRIHVECLPVGRELAVMFVGIVERRCRFRWPGAGIVAATRWGTVRFTCRGWPAIRN